MTLTQTDRYPMQYTLLDNPIPIRVRDCGHSAEFHRAPQIDQVVVVEWFGLPPQSQSRCPLGPSNGLATTTSHAACAPGNSAKWHLAKGFSRQVRARL